MRPRVIAGDEEARLTFRGALSGLSLRGKLLVFDIGGGSTELILGDAADQTALTNRVSLDIGSVRLFERHVHSDPPTAGELDSVAADVERALASATPLLGIEAGEAVTLVGVAGTVTTLKALELGLAPYDGARVHGAVLTLSAVEALCAKLASLPLAEREQLPGLEPKRADVIVAGALIVRDLLRRVRCLEGNRFRPRGSVRTPRDLNLCLSVSGTRTKRAGNPPRVILRTRAERICCALR